MRIDITKMDAKKIQDLADFYNAKGFDVKIESDKEKVFMKLRGN